MSNREASENRGVMPIEFRVLLCTEEEKIDFIASVLAGDVVNNYAGLGALVLAEALLWEIDMDYELQERIAEQLNMLIDREEFFTEICRDEVYGKLDLASMSKDVSLGN